MIKVYDSDTITDIIRKIIQCEDNEIILDFPFNHPTLHNYIFLKMIKAKAWHKRVTIVTNDIISRNIWKPLWINYSIIKDKDFFEENKKNTNILKHNYTFFEYLIFEIKKIYKNFINYIFWLNTVKTIQYKSKYYKVKKWWPILLIIWLIASISMMFFIFYFAVSKTYVNISPEINIKIKARNLIFKEHLETEEKILPQENIIKLDKKTSKINLESIFTTNGIDYENTSRAKWEVTFVNELKETQYLRPETRILSKNWILYETTDWVNIPAAIKNWSWVIVPWKVDASVIAQLYDYNWHFTWARWNLEEKDTFIIPWLKFNQDKIYAIYKSPLVWWDDDYTSVISEDDIKNSYWIFEEKLKSKVLEKLKEELKEENELNNVDYEILWVDDIIKYSEANIKTVWDLKVWDKVNEFKLIWDIEVTTYVYNKEAVLLALNNIIKTTLLEWTEKLMFIDDKSLRFSTIISREEDPTLEIKATSEIEVWIAYDFDNSDNSYIQKLKSIISWIDKEEAINILLNETTISNVEITNSPFFLKNVTKRIDNIIFTINK